MKQKLKLALVGAGERGQYCYAPYAKMHGYEIEFVAVADPHKGRREKFVQDYHVPAEGVFETAEQFFARPRMADAVLICTQDSQHYAYACQAIDLGYSILLEKPISPSVRECLDLQRRAEEKGTQIMVCHVMRYTKFYRKLKELIDSGVIGDVVHVTHTENVAYWHYAHSYVRGNWRRADESSPMILAKCCHDMDILIWLTGKRARYVSSYGNNYLFRAEKAPAGAARFLKRLNPKCVAVELCGSIGERPETIHALGIDAFFPIIGIPATEASAMDPETAKDNLRRTAAEAVRFFAAARAAAF